MLNLLSESTGNSSWIMLVVLAGVFILMMVMTILPQKKKKKQAMEMMNSLKVGSDVKTIGGFVGKIHAIDNNTGTIVLNIGTGDTEVLVTLDKGAIYTVLSAPAGEPTPTTESGAVIEETDVVSVDDAEEAAIEADKKAKKQAKKAKKDAEKQASETETTVTEEVKAEVVEKTEE